MLLTGFYDRYCYHHPSTPESHRVIPIQSLQLKLKISDSFALRGEAVLAVRRQPTDTHKTESTIDESQYFCNSGITGYKSNQMKNLKLRPENYVILLSFTWFCNTSAKAFQNKYKTIQTQPIQLLRY